MDLPFLSRFGRAVLNARRMLRDRGFLVPEGPTDELQVASELYRIARTKKCSLAEAVHSEYRNHKNQLISLWAFDRNLDLLKHRDRMISTDQVKHLQDCINKQQEGQHVILSPNKLSPQAKKEASKLTIFLFDELMIDLPRHNLVLPHRVVSLERCRELLGEKLDPKDLPCLPKQDSLSRWYNFDVGSIVFIDNPCMPSWRIVTD
jgi:hypothetical protein